MKKYYIPLWMQHLHVQINCCWDYWELAPDEYCICPTCQTRYSRISVDTLIVKQ